MRIRIPGFDNDSIVFKAFQNTVLLFYPFFSSRRLVKQISFFIWEDNMYHFIYLMILLMIADVIAQEQTLLKDENENGGFGGPVLKFTNINKQNAIMIGGRGGWILGHSLVLGGGGYAVINEIDAPLNALPLEGPLDIEFGYIGFEIEYIFDPLSLYHIGFYTLLGGGATNFVKDVGPVSSSNEQAGETAFMFVMEPAVNAELNMTEWFRLCVGISYRMTIGADQEMLDNGDFSGVNGTLTFKFGKF
jgi:hypothetical protein